MKRSHTIAIAVLAAIVPLIASTTPVHANPASAPIGTDTIQIQSGNGPGWYGVWATGVNVRRDSSEQCSDFPSTTYCPYIVTKVSAPQAVYVHCQQPGQTVGGNPYWVWINTASNHRGWMASYYTNNATNWIDGVPICTP